MNIDIKNRFTGDILFSLDIEGNTIKKTIEKAVSIGANLSGSNLYKANLRGADLRGAKLYESDLSGSCLSGSNLSGAGLFMAKMYGADLSGANLLEADLSGADMTGAGMRGASLTGCNLDYSCIPLHCGTLTAKTDERLRIQLAFHLLAWIKNSDNATDEEKKIYTDLLPYANKFHRTDVKKLV